MIIDQGVDVNTTDEDGWAAGANAQSTQDAASSPLQLAVSNNYIEIVKLLLAHGVNVNTPNKDDSTALHCAAQNGDEIVQLLLDAGTDDQEIINELAFWDQHRKNTPSAIIIRKFVFVDDKSNKFWNIEITRSSMRVTFGKTGTACVTKTKEFKNEAEAQHAAEKLIKEKTNKGYIKID